MLHCLSHERCYHPHLVRQIVVYKVVFLHPTLRKETTQIVEAKPFFYTFLTTYITHCIASQLSLMFSFHDMLFVSNWVRDVYTDLQAIQPTSFLPSLFTGLTYGRSAAMAVTAKLFPIASQARRICAEKVWGSDQVILRSSSNSMLPRDGTNTINHIVIQSGESILLILDGSLRDLGESLCRL